MARPPIAKEGWHLPRVVALVADLFFGERIQQGLAQLGYEAEVGEEVGPPHLEGPAPVLVLVDLEAPRDRWEPLIAAARQRGVPVLAFGPHVAGDLHTAALAAGASRSVAKSKLTADFAALVTGLAGKGGTQL